VKRQVHLSHRGRPNRKFARLMNQAGWRIDAYLARLAAAEDAAPRGTPERQGYRRPPEPQHRATIWDAVDAVLREMWSS
jgi:hypothetical protein